MLTLVTALPCAAGTDSAVTVSGSVTDTDGKPLDYVMIHVKGTDRSAYSDEKGAYSIELSKGGKYTVVFSSAGFHQLEKSVTVAPGGSGVCNAVLKPSTTLAGITVTGSQVSKVKNSAFNATAITTASLANSTRTVGDALAKAPGMKLRQNGGTGSDMNVTMDGFSGKHVKVFIDGVPHDGAGNAMSLNNLPVNFAERIEVYRGVVPVELGADAIGGVINIITPKRGGSDSFVDASYSYGSFNTHKAFLNLGRRFKNGFKIEINAFANRSDNNYSVYAPVEDFETGAMNRSKLEKVKRFNDRYRSESATVRAGFTGRQWADRLMFALTYTDMYKQIQTGVRQEIVYGQKHRRGHLLTPSVTWSKGDIIAPGLNMNFNADYKRNDVENVDTARVKYNWHGQTQPLNSPGEQSYMHQRTDNSTLSATYTANYRISDRHLVSLSDVWSWFSRKNHNLLDPKSQTDDVWTKSTRKNILGLSYRFTPISSLNISAFGKHYSQQVAGPVATTSAQDTWHRAHRSINTAGYGAAAAWSAPLGFQVKASYEKACRLPSVDEMFGDEDLENGDMTLRPETSHNLNLNLSYEARLGAGTLYAEGAVIYRDTRDYIQRNIMALSGGKSAATFVNYGKVSTRGFSLNARYSLGRWLVAGAGLTQMNVRDDMPAAPGSTAPNLSYGHRMPNMPYFFADSDVNLYWHGLGLPGNVLSFGYDNRFTKSFCYYASNIGQNSSDYMVPDQMEHNVSLGYSMSRGRYNLTAECTNLTDARLYDNFSLQRPGRAFNVKVRYKF